MDIKNSNIIEERLTSNAFVSYENMLKENVPLDVVAEKIIEGTYEVEAIEKKDSLDRFVDYTYFKIKTGEVYIPSMIFPTRVMIEKDIELKCKLLINEHLMPEIVFKLLKFFSRNIKDSETNLYVAHLVESTEIIKSVFDTFKLFKNDVFEKDPDKRTRNVKSIQQFTASTDNSIASPLDAACRLKYVLEYIHFKEKVNHIYTLDDIKMAPDRETT